MVTERKTIEIVLTNNDHVKLLVQILFFCNVDMKLYAIGRMTHMYDNAYYDKGRSSGVCIALAATIVYTLDIIVWVRLR